MYSYTVIYTEWAKSMITVNIYIYIMFTVTLRLAHHVYIDSGVKQTLKYIIYIKLIRIATNLR